MAYIYAYLDEAGVVRYIGKGNGDRSYVHLKKPHNQRFGKWLLSNTPSILRIAENLDEEAAFAMEKELIALHGRIRYEPGGTLFNHSEGGRGGAKGVKLSDETRQKMREDRAWRRGKEQSEQSSKQAKVSWADPSIREKQICSLRKSARFTATLAERMKPCTVDGVTIFESQKHMIKVLGQGKEGTESPNFKYLIEHSPQAPRPEMCPTKGLSYPTLEQGHNPPRYAPFSPPGRHRPVTSFTDIFSPIPVGGINGASSGNSKTKVPTTGQ